MIHQAESADARSARLWPDPFAAPDVPPREWLDWWFAGCGDADLVVQMASSPNCRRAAEALRQEHLSKALAGQTVEVPAEQPAQEQPLPDAGARTIGALVETRAEVELFDPDRAFPRWRLGCPPAAFLVQGPQDLRHDRIWRAVFAVPQIVVPDDFLGQDELVLSVDRARWLVLPALEYPLSDGQIARVVGRATDLNRDALLLAREALAKGLPLPPDLVAGRAEPGDPGRADHSARLLEEAAWLAALADARLQAAEWEAEIEHPLAENQSEEVFAVRAPEAQLAFAHGAEVVTRAFLLRLREGQTWQEALPPGKRLEEAGTPLTAVLKQRPADLGAGRLAAVWKLSLPLPAALVSALVAVVDVSSRRVLGTARADSYGVVRWDAPVGALGRTTVDQLALIIFSRV
jgi:hypothetical protein